MQTLRFIVLFVLLSSSCLFSFAQDSAQLIMQKMEQTVEQKKDVPKFAEIKTIPDTLKKFNPRIATIRSAIIPGWGQIYNRKYWKLPLVYGALGTTAGIFFYNLSTYNELKDAYVILVNNDSANFNKIDPKLRNLSPEAIRSYRNLFRQNIDYSVLFFLLFWGLNVVDATVDAHLKAFDVSSDLSLQIKAGYSPLARTNGISLVLNLDRRHM
ncbi:DUF5683 domain-containing protein [Ferruginibacter albus]|uniref:DUF5683 domain-containing protein n=1 Tax=Ferruginibacter albus TaxID=2875540 RepID=UPI001CC81269|nr:DUF5683 domain-containing protein [Ferruginibacter albus]UAY52812.1 hypothetical protein K9M53_03810 [Ferruginibacter albus]